MLSRTDSHERRPRLLSVLLAVAFAILPAHGVFAQADGNAYISFFSTGQVGVFNPGTNSIVATIPVGGSPNGLAVTPDGKYVYVVNTNDGIGAADAISVIDTATNSLVPVSFPVTLLSPEGVAVSSDGNFVYITYRNNSRLIIIDSSDPDAANHTLHANIIVQRQPNSVAVASVGGTNFAYVANSHLSDNSVSVVNTTSKNVVATLLIGDSPQSVVASVDGTRVYVAKGNGTLAAIDTSDNTWITSLSIGASPVGIAINHAGDRLYVTLATSNELAIVDTDETAWETGPAVEKVAVGTGPRGLALRPDGSEVVIANFGAGNSVTKVNTTIPVGMVFNLGQGQVQPRYVAFEPLEEPPPPPDAAPFFDASTSCDFTHEAVLDTLLAFTVLAHDDNGLTLSVDTLPAGASMSPPLPAGPGTSVSSDFSWTPTSADTGDYVLTFSADDTFNAPVTCAVTISVPAPPVNTPAGNGVAVSPVDENGGGTPVSVTFDNVTVGGDTSLSTASGGPGLPEGFALGTPPVYFDVSTTAVYTPSVSLCFDYSGMSFDDESELAVLHYDGTDWQDATTLLDTGNDVICATVTSLSTFVVAEPDESEPPVEGVEFLDFRVGVAKINTKGPHADSFWFNGNFAVDLNNGDGIDPANEAVAFGFAGTEFTIPAGEFRGHFRGRLFRFRGVVNGAKLLIHITQIRRNIYNVNITGWGAALADPQDPPTLCLRIGDDFGCDPDPRRSRVR